MTCQAMFLQSLDPPLLVFSPSLASTTWPLLAERAELAISVLATGQAGMARAFARPGADRFADVGWHPAPITGSPVLTGSHIALDCHIRSSSVTGDHHLVVADLLAVEAGDDPSSGSPVVFYRSAFHDLGPRLEELSTF